MVVRVLDPGRPTRLSNVMANADTPPLAHSQRVPDPIGSYERSATIAAWRVHKVCQRCRFCAGPEELRRYNGGHGNVHGRAKTAPETQGPPNATTYGRSCV